jgi:peptidyl-dipeptidase A
LQGWLKQQNEGQTCGWQAAGIANPPATTTRPATTAVMP